MGLRYINKLSGKYNALPNAAKAAFWFLFCSIVQKATTVLTIPIITRLLSPAEYGVYSIFNAYSNIIIIFGTLCLYNNGYYVGMKKYIHEKAQYTSSISSLMCLLTTIIFILVWTNRRWISEVTGLEPIVLVLIFLWMYGQAAIYLWFAEQRYEFQYRAIVKCTIFIAATTPTLKIVLIVLFGQISIDRSLGAILGYVLPICMVGAVAWIKIYRAGKKTYIKEYWKFALKFNIPLIPYYLSQNILNQADRIMIEQMDSMSNAGVYNVAYSLAMILTVINGAINNSFIPWQFQTMKRGDCRRVAKITNPIMVGITGIHILLIFLAPEIMMIFAAEEYYDAIYVIPPVTIGVLIMWMTKIFINTEFFYEKNKLISISSLVSAALNIVLNFLAIPRFGYLAAGYTTLICYFVNMVFHGVMAGRISKQNENDKPYNTKNMSAIVLISMIVMVCTMQLYKLPILRYMILIVFIIGLLINRKRLKEIVQGLWVEVRSK